MHVLFFSLKNINDIIENLTIILIMFVNIFMGIIKNIWNVKENGGSFKK